VRGVDGRKHEKKIVGDGRKAKIRNLGGFAYN
jgi:hypothetical protein